MAIVLIRVDHHGMLLAMTFIFFLLFLWLPLRTASLRLASLDPSPLSADRLQEAIYVYASNSPFLVVRVVSPRVVPMFPDTVLYNAIWRLVVYTVAITIGVWTA